MPSRDAGPGCFSAEKRLSYETHRSEERILAESDDRGRYDENGQRVEEQRDSNRST